jgi:hypothetical protein
MLGDPGGAVCGEAVHDARILWDMRVIPVLRGIVSHVEAFYRRSRFRNLHPVDAKGWP